MVIVGIRDCNTWIRLQMVWCGQMQISTGGGLAWHVFHIELKNTQQLIKNQDRIMEMQNERRVAGTLNSK